MSPGGTMTRVYAALKARVLAGEFRPGDRLDPTRLSAELAASVTPVRDALQRLTGERLIESWEQEGFRQPLVSEAGLRELYGWSSELTGMVLRAAERAAAQPEWDEWHRSGQLGDDAADVFSALADRADNHERRAVVMALNERCHRARTIEGQLDPGAGAELPLILVAAKAGKWREARRALELFHRHGLRRVPEIAAQLRPRERR